MFVCLFPACLQDFKLSQVHICNSRAPCPSICEMEIDNGETLHSFRSGCAITLALSGSPLGMSHVGWANSKMALHVYYLKLADVLRAGGPSDLLTSDSYFPLSQEALHVYGDFNDLKNCHHFSCYTLSKIYCMSLLFTFCFPFYSCLSFGF